jgi:hypothetical protein
MSGTWTGAGILAVGASTNIASATISGTYTTAAGININVGNSSGNTGTSSLNIQSGAAITVNYSGTSNGNFNVATTDGAVSAVNQSGGSVTVTGSFFLGSSSTATGTPYGFYNLTGGTLTATGAASSSARFRLAAANGSGVGVMYVSGGTASWQQSAGSVDIASGASFGANATPVGVVYVTGTGSINSPGESLYVARMSATGSAGTQSSIGQLTIGGAGSTTASGVFGDVSMSGTSASLQPGNAYINLLAGGTLTAGSIAKNPLGSAYLAFNGGTLTVGAASKTLSALTAVTSYAGGATINTNGNGYAVSAPIAAATGSGVTGITVATGGSN